MFIVFNCCEIFLKEEKNVLYSVAVFKNIWVLALLFFLFSDEKCLIEVTQQTVIHNKYTILFHLIQPPLHEMETCLFDWLGRNQGDDRWEFPETRISTGDSATGETQATKHAECQVLDWNPVSAVQFRQRYRDTYFYASFDPYE